jgi:hypothetical protein
MTYNKLKTCDWCDSKLRSHQAISFPYQHSDFLLCSQPCLIGIKKMLHVKPNGYYDRRKPTTNPPGDVK